MRILQTVRDRAAAEVRRRPFLRLAQHFMFRTAGTSATSEMDLGLGGALAILAVPGAFSSILLASKYSSLLQWLRGNPNFDPYKVCVPDEYFFIVYSLAITGLATLLRWDRLLPDARDFANLAPLPIRARAIFGANLLALALLAALFAFDINLVSAFLFPFFVTLSTNSGAAFFEFAWAHVLAVMGISIFTFLALLALQGLSMALLPEGIHRKFVLALRTVLLILFAGTLISVLIIPIPILQINRNSPGALQYWPPLWFLSLFEDQVGKLQHRSALGSGYGLWALATAGVLCLLGFALSYQRYFLKIAERQNGPVRASKRSGMGSRLVTDLFRPLMRPGLETATLAFTIRTLLRSEVQILWLGLWLGMGLLLSLQSLKLADESLHAMLVVAPMLFTFFAMTGMRSVFDVPSVVQANWIFRLLAFGATTLPRSACYKMLLAGGLTPLALVWLPCAIHFSGIGPAMIIGFLHFLVTALGAELLLWNFHKVPFTCSFSPERDRLVKAFLVGLAFLGVVLPILTTLEMRAISQPAVFVILTAALLYPLISLRRSQRTNPEPLLYEDTGLPSMALLRLSGD